MPFHISVGAIVVNDKGKILVHKRVRENTPERFLDSLGDLNEVYLLMRESLENGETLEEGVRRGIQEEFGVEGVVDGYLGSLQTMIPSTRGAWEKTTLYFRVQVTKIGERPQDDGEAHSILEWQDANFLISKMKEQGKNTKRLDLDESKIIEAYVKFS
jgi:ADP-ribose pyrophosphatase YjhB (NUDIX family)